MFFADMLSYERFSCSLTGLSYAHAPHGPVMNRKDEIRYTLVDRGTIGFREIGWEEVVVPLKHTACPFNVEELALIDEVAHFVNSFSTANELSDFSHKLSCWHETVDGQIIEYTRDRGEVGRALQERAAGYGR